MHPDAVLVHLGADEHSRAAAPQRRGVDARVLQRLPRGLQREPLLRIHRQRLTGADAEEVRVELRGRVEESTTAHVTLADGAGIVVEHAVEVPAAVGGELAQHRPLFRDQPPEVLRGRHAAGEPAADADDRERLVRRVVPDGPRRHVGGFTQPEQFGPQVPGQRRRCRVIERHGGRQVETGRLAQPHVQVDQRERVEPGVAERAVGGDRGAALVRPGPAQHRERVLAHELQQCADLLGNRQPRQLQRKTSGLVHLPTPRCPVLTDLAGPRPESGHGLSNFLCM
ncbi:hypothetical protein GCM10023192_07490 [Amycolatopsis samaneae]